MMYTIISIGVEKYPFPQMGLLWKNWPFCGFNCEKEKERNETKTNDYVTEKHCSFFFFINNNKLKYSFEEVIHTLHSSYI